MNDIQFDLKNSLGLELRRGVLVLAVLSQLRQEHYGYSLKKLLSSKGIEIEEGTLYPLMRRLEAQGLLESAWRVEGSRPRRYYKISKNGESALKSLSKDWISLTQVMEGLL